jgi:hypothetical protein
MYKSLFVVLAIFIPLTLATQPAEVHSEEIKLIKAGDHFPDIPLQAPKKPDDRKYLGLGEGETFTLKDIKAGIVLVEVMSVYCPSCQRQVKPYNKLLNLIEGNVKTKGRIKMIGIAAGNGDVEVEDFRTKYKVGFPIIPDPKYELHEAIGGSRTPFAIYVKQDPTGEAGVVTGTHLGTDKRYKKRFQKLAKLLTTEVASLRRESEQKKAVTIVVEPVLSDSELRDKVKAAFSTPDGTVTDFREIKLERAKKVYTALVTQETISKRLFAKVTSRPPTCDVCHDIHFIYVFDASGEVLAFEPIQLTKWGNKPWTDTDVAKMRGRVVGRNIFQDYGFNPKVDAVSSATITSGVVIDAVFKGKRILAELKDKGIL